MWQPIQTSGNNTTSKESEFNISEIFRISENVFIFEVRNLT